MFQVIRHIEAPNHPITVYESYEQALCRIGGQEVWEVWRERLLRSFGQRDKLRAVIYRAAYYSEKYD